MQDNAIKKVVIVGGGTAGWLSAAILCRAFGKSLEIELVESEDIGIVGVGEATIPTILYLCRYLGLNEDDVLRETQGTYKLGIEFVNWGSLNHSYGHWFGALGHPLALLPFHQYWLRARQDHDVGGIEDYSLNARAAKGNLMAKMEMIPDSPLEGLAHAWHFDATLFGQYLSKICQSSGVKRTEGKIINVEQDVQTGDITRLNLEDGNTVSGEFFIDCSGFRGLLIQETLKSGYRDYSEWLRVDRAWAVPTKNSGPLLPYTRATAHSAGWQWRIPLQHRQGNGHVFSSAYMTEDEGLNVLNSHLEADSLAEPRLIKFVTGHRKQFWKNNCVAIGLASGFLEPLESTAIHMVQSAMLRLLNHFPDKSMSSILRTAYNDKTQADYEWIRDFIILHYKASTRNDSQFWRDCTAMSVPDSLKRKIDIFRTNGLIATETDDLFRETSWVQVLLGQGIIPERASASTSMIDEASLLSFMGDIKTIHTKALGMMQPHATFIARHCAQKGAA